MSTLAQNHLIRKQYLLSQSNVRKLERFATQEGKSAAHIVRDAIDAYDPQDTEAMTSPELMALVSTKLKQAIESTQQANKKMAVTLKQLENKR